MGAVHGAFSFLEEFVPALKKLPRVILHVYTMLVVTVGFVIFRSDTLGFALGFIGKMFTGFEFSALSMSFVYQVMTPFFIVMLLAAMIGCAPIRRLTVKLRTVSEKAGKLTPKENIVQIILYTAAFALLLWCMIRLSGGSYNPFIYFRF